MLLLSVRTIVYKDTRDWCCERSIPYQQHSLAIVQLLVNNVLLSLTMPTTFVARWKLETSERRSRRTLLTRVNVLFRWNSRVPIGIAEMKSTERHAIFPSRELV